MTMADIPEAFLDEFIGASVRGIAAALKELYRDDARMISLAAGVDAQGRGDRCRLGLAGQGWHGSSLPCLSGWWW
jgi:hypothetical protein